MLLVAAAPRAHLTDESVGTSYTSKFTHRLVTVYLPLAIFVFVLLFPFYWMSTTALKPKTRPMSKGRVHKAKSRS